MKNKIILAGFIAGLLLLLSGCTTPKVPRPPSTYLLNTEKSQVQLMTELSDMLTKNKYEIKNLNTQTGFLLTKPRRFTVKRADGSKVSTEQNLIIRQEGGSVTVRANYDCEYFDKREQLVLQPCDNDDAEVNQRIRKIEALLVKQIRESLEAESVNPVEKDVTVDAANPAQPAQKSQTPVQK